MDLFKTAQRIPPRRVPIVRKFSDLPQKDNPIANLAMQASPRRGFALIGAGVGFVVLMGIYSAATSTESANPQQSAAASIAAKVAGGHSPAPEARRVGSGGGGGGGGGGAPAQIVMVTATESLMVSIRKLVFSVKKNPSTVMNLSDRLALFEKYFNSLAPEDRRALFGCADFRQLQATILAQSDRAPMALDRCLAQLRLILF